MCSSKSNHNQIEIQDKMRSFVLFLAALAPIFDGTVAQTIRSEIDAHGAVHNIAVDTKSYAEHHAQQ